MSIHTAEFKGVVSISAPGSDGINVTFTGGPSDHQVEGSVSAWDQVRHSILAMIMNPEEGKPGLSPKLPGSLIPRGSFVLEDGTVVPCIKTWDFINGAVEYKLLPEVANPLNVLRRSGDAAKVVAVKSTTPEVVDQAPAEEAIVRRVQHVLTRLDMTLPGAQGTATVEENVLFIQFGDSDSETVLDNDEAIDWALYTVGGLANQPGCVVKEAVVETTLENGAQFKTRFTDVDGMRAWYDLNVGGDIADHTPNGLTGQLLAIDHDLSMMAVASVGGVMVIAGTVEAVGINNEEQELTITWMIRNNEVKRIEVRDGKVRKPRDITLYEFLGEIGQLHKDGFAINMIPTAEATWFDYKRPSSFLVKVGFDDPDLIDSVAKLRQIVRTRVVDFFGRRISRQLIGAMESLANAQQTLLGMMERHSTWALDVSEEVNAGGWMEEMNEVAVGIEDLASNNPQEPVRAKPLPIPVKSTVGNHQQKTPPVQLRVVPTQEAKPAAGDATTTVVSHKPKKLLAHQVPHAVVTPTKAHNAKQLTGKKAPGADGEE